MGTFSIWHWLIVLIVVVLIFGGRGKISSIMEDLSKGLKAFRKGINHDENEDSNKNISKASNDKQ